MFFTNIDLKNPHILFISIEKECPEAVNTGNFVVLLIKAGLFVRLSGGFVILF